MLEANHFPFGNFQCLHLFMSKKNLLFSFRNHCGFPALQSALLEILSLQKEIHNPVKTCDVSLLSGSRKQHSLEKHWLKPYLSQGPGAIMLF